MEGMLLPILAMGFLLGVKHAIEPDHIIAVSTIASHRSPYAFLACGGGKS
ncbi:hypothetical protein BSNK01_11690 [Bacillaceae bacterium]